MELSGKAQRVLGALVEKAMATPEGYPLSLNALRTACNQKTGRDPVVTYLEADVVEGIAELKEHGLILTKYTHGSRVPKYAHLLDEKLDFRAGHLAVIGVLLLRGAQTAGEVKGRTARLHDFATLGEVEDTLTSLLDHKFYGAFVERLPRAPGQKEERWRHLLGPAQESSVAPAAPTVDQAELDELRAEVERLRAREASLLELNAHLQAELAQLQLELDELTAP